MSPFISIIIPTYNRAHLIEHTILSLLRQSFQDYEILIMDDGSTDNTEDVIKPFLSDKFFYYKKENAERAAARNYGAEKAKGKIYYWKDHKSLTALNKNCLWV